MRKIADLENAGQPAHPDFRPGDTVRVHVRIKEGDKERIQVFEGIVLQKKRGGASASFVVRKVSYGVGVERIFPLQSPNVTKIEVKTRGRVRRARLTYLRDLSGKAARIRELEDFSETAVAPKEGPQAATEAGAAPRTPSKKRSGKKSEKTGGA